MNRIVNKNFINFLLASTLFLGSVSCAYAVDTVRAYEIIPSDEIKNNNDDSYIMYCTIFWSICSLLFNTRY